MPEIKSIPIKVIILLDLVSMRLSVAVLRSLKEQRGEFIKAPPPRLSFMRGARRLIEDMLSAGLLQCLMEHLPPASGQVSRVAEAYKKYLDLPGESRRVTQQSIVSTWNPRITKWRA